MKIIKNHIDRYEELRRKALLTQFFCEKQTAAELWCFSSQGMAKWLNTPVETGSATISQPEISRKKISKYPHTLICLLTDMILTNL